MVHSASTPRRWLHHCLGVILLLSITTAIDAFTIPNCCSTHRPSTIHHLSDRNNEGENHHNYNQITDDAQNSNNIPKNDDMINAVDTLINERILARKEKNFRRADMLSSQLLTQYSVVLNDSDLTWKVATKRQVKKRISLTKKAKAVLPSNNVRSNNDDAFQLSPKSDTNVSTLSEEEILAMLDSRRAAQRTRDYEKADSIRNTLKSDGVYIDDGMKEYRFDGVPFKQRGRTHDDMSMSSSRGSSWELRQSEHSIPLPSDDAERIVHDLLRQRSNARSGGNYAQSDAIRDELYESYNIRLDDKLGEWSCGGSFGDSQDHWTSTTREVLVEYTKSEMSRSLPSSDEGFIQDKVDERMRAKRTRNYKLADYIRDKLYDTYDVTIHDKLNLWSVGGEFGEGNEWNHNTKLKDSSDAGDDRELDSGEEKSAPIQVVGEVSAILSRDELECLTVVQLKDKLRNSGLTVSGTKAKLINRLLGDESELKR